MKKIIFYYFLEPLINNQSILDVLIYSSIYLDKGNKKYYNLTYTLLLILIAN